LQVLFQKALQFCQYYPIKWLLYFRKEVIGEQVCHFDGLSEREVLAAPDFVDLYLNVWG
jgi:hypothetical protein